MSFGSVENYQDSGELEVLESGMGQWIKVYSASAIVNGKACAIIVEAVTAATPDCSRYAVAAVQETTARTAMIGVVDNGILGKSGIAAGGYGFVCVRGQVEAYGGATVVANRFLKVLAAEDEFKDGAVASSGDGPATCNAVSIDALADGELSTIFLLGRLNTVAAA